VAEQEFDVVVVGAGTAGANVAHQFARRGRRVLVLERRAADAAGAQWVNGVLDRHFELAGLAPPSGPERRAANRTVQLRGRDPRLGPTVHDAPTVAADMALLGHRLRALATGAGAQFCDRVTDLGFDHERSTDRIRSVSFRRDDERGPTTVAAALFVDASGRQGVVRRHSVALGPWCPTVRGNELCSASDVEHLVADTAGAAEFLERHGAAPGETVTVVGVSGGFSTCAVSIAEDLGHVGILVGCLADGRYGTGPRMLAELQAREPWIGPARSAGSGVIPLRRPYARFTAPGVALVGDAACQVFPAHGSGIGIGLIAGTMLAEGAADADDPGDPEVLWRSYQAPFQRRHGGDLAGFDLLRRTSTALGSTGVDALVRSGIVDERTTRAGLDQRWATPPPAEAARSAARLARNPRVARVMAPALLRAQLLRTHARTYPEQVDPDALRRWEHRTARLLGRLPG